VRQRVGDITFDFRAATCTAHAAALLISNAGFDDVSMASLWRSADKPNSVDAVRVDALSLLPALAHVLDACRSWRDRRALRKLQRQGIARLLRNYRRTGRRG
jgi:hypothetical protein